MRYLAIFLALAPSLVSAWRVREFSDSLCEKPNSHHKEGSGADSGKFSNGARNARIDQLGKGETIYTWTKGNDNDKVKMEDRFIGWCMNLSGETYWEIRK